MVDGVEAGMDGVSDFPDDLWAVQDELTELPIGAEGAVKEPPGSGDPYSRL